jgi:Ion channel
LPTEAEMIGPAARYQRAAPGGAGSTVVVLPDLPFAPEDGDMPPSPARVTWAVVVRLAVIVTAVSSVIVLGGGTALWFIERDRPGSTMDSWGDAVWWSLTTMTTVGYGDHVPVTTTGRLIAAGVMVAGVAIIGAVAAVVALAVARRVAREEERAIEAEAETLEQRLEVRLARIEARLAGLEALLQAWSPTASGEDPGAHGRA